MMIRELPDRPEQATAYLDLSLGDRCEVTLYVYVNGVLYKHLTFVDASWAKQHDLAEGDSADCKVSRAPDGSTIISDTSKLPPRRACDKHTMDLAVKASHNEALAKVMEREITI